MLLKLEKVSFIYKPRTPYAAVALSDISLTVDRGEFIGIIGPTGSGKSTLVQLFNGLLKPVSGKVYVDGIDIWGKGVDLRQVRQKVGLLFQNAEQQLFGETIFQDVAFAPRNLGMMNTEVAVCVQRALSLVGLDYESFRDRSPLTLSGGQKRRVALAGVLAMEPQVLILDEPTAGLDPVGARNILTNVFELYRRTGMAVVVISHEMEEIARFASRLFVLSGGKLVFQGGPREIFNIALETSLKDLNLDVPQVVKLMHQLQLRGWPVRTDVLTLEEAYTEIVSAVNSIPAATGP
jgi:energy-coupling factor transport system ATP-binding protein